MNVNLDMNLGVNVTSVLSRGYLEPARRVSDAAGGSGSASLAAQEQQILAQERMLKTTSGAGTRVSTTYRYTIGPDGRRYITGAEVTIQGDEAAVDRVGGGVKRAVPTPVPGETGPEEANEKEVNEKEANEKTDSGTKEAVSAAEAEQENSEGEAVRELRQIEREVISHEAAHQAAGGRFAGAVSYTYTRGPDGHAYITGGEVPIHVPPSSDPEQTMRDMEQVQRAALAPASPSGQDRAVAAQAAAAAAQARQEASAARTRSAFESRARASGAEPGAFKTGASSVQAELFRDRVSGQSDPARAGTAYANGRDDLEEAKGAYARAASPLGLWALGWGFERLAPRGRESEFSFEIAA
ncbi:MAG: hypothetical protein LBO82_00905 [Synergistaceae bacterium]|jgi:hypothetical protein|nr:hypothetical protein [Synergistaceae bacterium]